MRILVFTASFLLVAAGAAAQTCRISLAPGQAEPAIRDVQTQLQAHGYKPGPVDGQLGPRTCEAVRRYQKQAGLPVDGVIDPKLQNHMHFVSRRPSEAPRR